MQVQAAVAFAASSAFNNAISRVRGRPNHVMPQQQQDLSNLTPPEQRARRREWNRGPLTDLFPRLPEITLERLLDIIIDKGFTYNLGHSRFANSRRYTSIVVAHCRHAFSDYDRLLHEKVERYEARRRTGDQVWKVLREWSPWEKDNEVLERCFKATLLSAEERDSSWDPMDVDEESEFEDDPMDLD